jgi:type VI secretion system secreted protein VgrG
MVTTSPQFEACMPFILKEEGGYSNTPGDHGGATNFGIIQSEYNIFRHSLGLGLQSVRMISSDEYRTIYWQSYWQPHCPELPAGLNLSVFNINVNGGSGRGTKLIQKCLGIAVDGVWGNLTSLAVQSAVGDGAVRKLIVAFHDDERQFYQAIIDNNPSQHKFAADWFGRNDRCEKLSLSMFDAAQAVA